MTSKRGRAPEELVGALQDRIHPTSGRLLAAKPIDSTLAIRIPESLRGRPPVADPIASTLAIRIPESLRGRPPVADPIASTLAIRIPESLRARLAARAARDGQSVSELVRAAIDAALAE